MLDLDGAKLEPGSAVALPQAGGTTGHIDELRFDPNDVAHIGVGTSASTRRAREDALALVEAAARRGGDTSAANRAFYARRTLARRDEVWFTRGLDYVFFFGAAGYFVAPLHPLTALVVLLFLFAAARWALPRRRDPPRPKFHEALRHSWGLLWRLDIRQGTVADSVEAVVYKLAFLVLLLNLANVWPPVHDLVKGVFV
jgi:hypothetical protein